MPSLLHHSVPLAASRPLPSQIDNGPVVTRLDNVLRRPYDPDVENGEIDAQQQQQQEVPSDAIIGLCYHQRMVGCAWFHSHSHTVSFHSASLALDDRYSSSSSSSTAAPPPHSLLNHGMQERSGGAGGLSDPSLLLLEEDPPLWFQALTDSLWNHHHQRTTAHNNSFDAAPAHAAAGALSTMRLCCCADTPYCFVRPFQRLSSSSSSRQRQQGAEQLEAHQEQAAFSSSPSLPSSSVSICNKGERSAAFLRQQLALLWPHVTPAEWTVRLPMQDLRIVAAISFVLEACIRQGVLVADIVPEAPPSLVAVDAHTLAALRIFRTEDHPLAHHGVGQGKEGLSLFALLSMHCCTSMGRDLLRRWLSSPSNDAALLSQRQEAIGAFVPQHRLRTEIGKLLPSIPHCGRLLCRLQAGTHGTQTYASLRVAARTYTQLMRLLSSSSSSPEGARLASLPCVRRLLETYHHDAVDTFASMIETTIDCSRRGGGGVPRDVRGAAVRNVRILPGVDSELDELRQHVERLGPYLTETAKLVASELTDQEPFRSWHLQCVFVPRVGYLMAVPSAEVFRSDAATDAAADDTAAVVAMSLPDGSGGDGFALERSEHNAATGAPLPPAGPPQEGLRPMGWELLYTAHAVVYFRTPHTRELDERIGDVHAALVDRCGVVQAEFDTRLLSVGFAVLPTLHVAELDAILALTRVAHDHGWTCPKWASFAQEGRTDERGGGRSMDDNVPLIDIRGAVHPLLRSCGMHVVPIDFNSRLRDKPASLSVLLGANGSGKSTYLQTIGTVCYLAHIGSFVPCPAAGGCTFSRPLQRLECIAAGSKDGAFLGTTSSFVHEMALLARATATAQSSSPSHHGGGGGTNLLLVDEFGRGTLASDGVSLLASVLHSFRVYHSSERSRAAASPSFPSSSSSSVVLLSSHYSELRLLIRTVPQLSGIRVLYTTTTTTTTLDTSGDAEGADGFSPLFTVRPDDAEEEENDHSYDDEDDVRSRPQAHLVARAPRDSSYHAECMQAFACAVRHGVLPSVVRRGVLLCEARRAEQRKQQLAWDADSTTRVAGELTMLLRRYEEEGEGGEITTRNTGGPDVGAEEEEAANQP